MRNGSKPEQPKPYNPLEKRKLAESIVRELLSQSPEDLPPQDRFKGAGVYAIYYRGDFPLYAPLTRANRKQWRVPLYVGKAVPPGGRKGGFPEKPSAAPALHHRLAEHAETIEQARNLNIKHFACRHLAVDEVWIKLAELLLIEDYKPLWNIVVDGFGNHNPGAPRGRSMRPNWDTLHPGRAWAAHLQPSALTLKQIRQRVKTHLQRKLDG